MYNEVFMIDKYIFMLKVHTCISLGIEVFNQTI